MATLIINEQDMINAICLYLSHEKDVEPDEIEVELFYDDETEDAYGAEVTHQHQMEEIGTPKIIASLRLWLNLYTDIDGIAAGLKLHFNEDDGIYASAW